MVNMFRHYPQPDDYKPDNYPKHRRYKKLEIMAGETAIHSFDIPFNVEDDCTMVEVIYKLGIEPVVIKNNMFYLDILVNDDDTSVVTCKLTPDDTLLFKNTALDTHVQLKFYMNDGSIVYSEIYKVFVKDSLDAVNRKDKPFPQDDIDAEDTEGEQVALGGYGYTED